MLSAALGGARAATRPARTCLRCFSSTSSERLARETDAPSSELRTYVSTSTSPVFNLALEDHLFRTTSLTRATPYRPSTGSDRSERPRPLCFIYRNRPCVVIGRNQNPWKELNVRELARLKIPMVRRRSGGGTVFHDLGNTNYSIHVDKDDFTKRANAELVARSLNGLLHPASQLQPQDGGPRPTVYVNHRSDICLRIATHGTSMQALPAPADPTIKPDPPDPAERKLSGSAYKLNANRAYHHGTLLLRADLASLGQSLHHPASTRRAEAMQSKGVASVRAAVVNLVEAFPDAAERLTHEAVSRAIVREFGSTYARDDFELGMYASPDGALEPGYVDERSEVVRKLGADAVLYQSWAELESWDWLFGQTPEFTHKLVADASTSSDSALGSFGLVVRCRRGIIDEARLCGLKQAVGRDGNEEDPEDDDGWSSSKVDESAKPSFPDASTEQIVRSLVERMEGLTYDELAAEVPICPPSAPTSIHDNDAQSPTAVDVLEPGRVAARLDRAVAKLWRRQGSGTSKDEEGRRVAVTFVRWLHDVL